MKASPIRFQGIADVLNRTEANCTYYDVNKAAENQQVFFITWTTCNYDIYFVF